jgi:hypothetical protein
MVILVSGSLLGGVAGYFISPLLVADRYFAGHLKLVLVPASATIGLLLAYLVARYLVSREEEASVQSGTDPVETFKRGRK